MDPRTVRAPEMAKFLSPASFHTNSKVVRVARNIFIAGFGGRQSKLLGVGTGGQLAPNFCTGRLKVCKNWVFRRKWRPVVR